MTYEIPGSPRRAGMVCWQIRHERQPDGSYRMRREYAYPDGVQADPVEVEPAPSLDAPRKVLRGVAPHNRQGALL